MGRIAAWVLVIFALTLGVIGVYGAVNDDNGNAAPSVETVPEAPAAPAAEPTTTLVRSPAPTEASADPCAGIDYLGYAPEVDGIAFGPDVRPMIAGFDELSASDKAIAVAQAQRTGWCEYSAVALANAMHRGIVPWPESQEDWTAKLTKLHESAEQRADLMAWLVWWEDACVSSMTVVYDESSYNSDWFDRTQNPLNLVQGPGHADVRGWVIRREVVQDSPNDDCIGFRAGEEKPFTTLDERLVCFWQIALDFPIPHLPPVPPEIPPTTVPVTTVPPPDTTSPPGTTTPTTVPVTTVPTTPPTTERPTTTVPTTPPTTIPCGNKNLWTDRNGNGHADPGECNPAFPSGSTVPPPPTNAPAPVTTQRPPTPPPTAASDPTPTNVIAVNPTPPPLTYTPPGAVVGTTTPPATVAPPATNPAATPGNGGGTTPSR